MKASVPPPALSKAHELSRSAIIDPSYSVTARQPDGGLLPERAPWVYGHGELEAWRHALLRERGLRAMGGNLYYPGAFHTASTRASFRRRIPSSAKAAQVITIRAVGDITAYYNGSLLFKASASDKAHAFSLPEADGGEFLIELSSPDDLPTLLIEEGPLRTGLDWSWRNEAGKWEKAAPHSQHRSGQPPGSAFRWQV